MEDDAGDNVTVIESSFIEQVGLMPGLWTIAGSAEERVDVIVTRVELLGGADGPRDRMVVAFRQGHLIGRHGTGPAVQTNTAGTTS